ncbi:MAG: hypothetical protein JWM11_1078 [Planctomycetaceae bacterium]|nr:hypothetical protein [Planctomycetaceae bacterium]
MAIGEKELVTSKGADKVLESFRILNESNKQ